mgnify:CR=1 FL=1
MDAKMDDGVMMVAGDDSDEMDDVVAIMGGDGR